MSHNDVSRRRFIQSAAGAASSAALTAGAAPRLARHIPRRAWTILGINWEYNDEFCFEAGEFIEPTVFFDEQEARAACQKLCAAFFGETPQEFQPCWDAYEVDPATATWDDLRQAGFPDPYYLKELMI